MVDSREFEWIGHHISLRDVVVEGIVKCPEPLRVGSGRETGKFSPIDLPIVKVYNVAEGKETPVIPGSSWKGVFRSTAYRLCVVNGLNVCAGIPRQTCLRGREFQAIERSNVPNEIEAKIKAILDGTIRVCLLCLIFGGPGIYSHVVFSESLPIGEFRLGYRTCVAIDRRTGAAHPRALYNVEYVEPGVEFGFSLTARNLPNYALGLLANIIMEIHNGIVRVGGGKSRGFGRVMFPVEKLKVKIKTYGEKGKLEEGVLRGLDPLDSEVDLGITEPEVEGKEAWRVIEALSTAWTNSLSKLRRVSESNWKWGIITS